MFDLRKHHFVEAALVAVLIIVGSFPSQASSFRAVIDSDLDRDGRIERIDLDSEREMTLQIMRGPTYLAPDDAGEFEFTLSADGKSYSGRWRYGSKGAWQPKEWTGTRANVP